MTHDAARPDSPDTPIDWEALARYLSGESSAPERERIERYLAAHPADAEVVSSLDNAMRILAFQEIPDVDVEAALQRVTARRDAPAALAVPISSRRQHTTPPRRTFARPGRIASVVAAAAVVILAARAVLQRNGATRTGSNASRARTFATAVGRRDSLRLPDGGRVILGPASRLTIAEGYGDRVREVELHGEAYFDVVHDTTHPFVVRLATATIRDVGTSFAVREDGARVRVVVTSGAVLFRSSIRSTEPDSVGAGDVATLEPDGRVFTDRGVPTASFLSWIQGSLVFRNTPVAEVGAELQRWYGITLRIDDSVLARKHVNATFRGDPTDRVLRIIGLELGAEVERHGDTAILRPRAR
jgi:transmembrane sensor